MTTLKFSKYEEIAANYLREKGYRKIEKIDNRSGGVPDLLSDGEYFEVATTRQSSLTFTRAQMRSFPKINPRIVVVKLSKMGAPRVLEIVPFSKLEKLGYTVHEGIA